VSIPHKARPERPVLLSFLVHGTERVANELYLPSLSAGVRQDDPVCLSFLQVIFQSFIIAGNLNLLIPKARATMTLI